MRSWSVLGGVLVSVLLPLSAAAVATMQNDSESIALPSTVSDGQVTPIFDNPDLIQQWAQGAAEYSDYYTYIGTAFVIAQSGAGTVSIGDDTTAATSESFVSFLGEESGVTYAPRTTATISGGNGTIVIVASKLRQALAGKGLLTLEVQGWDFDDTRFVDDTAYYESLASFDTSDLVVIATAIVFKNQALEDVRIEGERLFVTYRASGTLLWFIPVRFTVYLSIHTGGKTDAERVQLTYPWWRIFISLPVSPNALAANLNASIVGMQAAGLNTELAQAKLFTYVSNLLVAGGGSDVAGLPTK